MPKGASDDPAELVELLMEETTERMDRSLESTRSDLSSIRTGRANPALVDKVTVDAYGSKMPLTQLATISAPEARLLVIAPWDKGNVDPIMRAIQAADLGFNPQSDGNLVRIPIPQLTEETRRDLIRRVARRIEEGKVSVRNARREGIEELKTLKKDGGIGDDEEKRIEAEVQKLTDQHIDELDRTQAAKEEELLEV